MPMHQIVSMHLKLSRSLSKGVHFRDYIPLHYSLRSCPVTTPPLPKLFAYELYSYDRTVTAWSGSRITMISPANKPIAHIPLNFVIQRADNAWAHVTGAARQLVVGDDGWIFDGSQTVNPTDLPFAGTFVHSSQGM